MSGTSLKFGTSGLRGLADELNGLPAYAYSLAFVGMLSEAGKLHRGDKVFVGRDLRPSSPTIAALCMAAIEDAGFQPVDCGVLPTPALSNYAISQQAPSIMVTGSHIPDDRNGLKFYRADGEIDKNDESAISVAYAALPANLAFRHLHDAPYGSDAIDLYVTRYVGFLGHESLRGLRVGVYQHSSVARDLIVRILTELGAEAVPLGRSDVFVPVDTEALRSEDIELLDQWAKESRFDAIVSTDGDADRPLIADEKGRFVRGDLVGAITARWLGVKTIVTPVTSNSALEENFERVIRTRVGSPYVIEGMTQAIAGGTRAVVGFEANGGVLLGTDINRDGHVLAALSTRDALLPILGSLGSIKETGKPLSDIAASFHFRTALSDRLQNVPQEKSLAFLSLLKNEATRSALFQMDEPIVRTEAIDGVKLFFHSGNAIHYRASGNAPELRCYVESSGESQAKTLLETGLAIARNATKDN
ncbi:phosphomannomutase [Ochrobactrum sp. 695/2009]|nr:phosphomannomutase [Brucella intermedia]PJR90226.1 phosphomannomutase [Ochrobactrum sp. 721/2009]PJT16486.1 phosphomannomutase [Ochrobactrum sp. 720/2009]PJT26307.1 phosphomannomutase [Ochrobactrum sp. 715/2009]PJT29912.1 phosphomannomutase [Ochrobactrum sp. 695/2009]PJT35826.1 phosphomannomutase [Ochrobactrum sp. 689/2009]